MLFQMLSNAIANGFIIRVLDDCGMSMDYNNVSDAMDDIEAVDEVEIEIMDGDRSEGWALIVNTLDDDERIADASGWINRWMDEAE